MKTTFFKSAIKSLPILAALFFFSHNTMATNPEEDFRIMKQKNGIDLFYRWMVMPEGNKVRQMKAVFEVNGSTDQVISLLKDEQQALAWIPSAQEYRNLEPATGPEWASYIKFSAPWPLADQDCILEYTASTTGDGAAVIEFACNPDYLQPVDGVTRMKDINGTFVIHSQPGGKTLVECYFLSKKASVIPRWITDPIISGSIISLMEGMRDQLSDVEYSQILQK